MPKIQLKKIINKKTIYMLISLIAVILITFGTLFVVNTIIKNNNSNSVTGLKSSADELKSEAIKVMTTNPEKAKTLLNQAKEKYQKANDANNVMDSDALIYVIDHK